MSAQDVIYKYSLQERYHCICKAIKLSNKKMLAQRQMPKFKDICTSMNKSRDDPTSRVHILYMHSIMGNTWMVKLSSRSIICRQSRSSYLLLSGSQDPSVVWPEQ